MSEHDASQEVLRLQGLRKSYNVGKPTEVEVLHGLDLRLQRRDFAALVGASGSGKSTLLNLIGLLDRPTAGELFLLAEPTSTMDDARRTALRGSAIGFVFQFHHLIQAFTVLENVLMPLMVATGKPTRSQIERARNLLAQVGLEGLDQRRPDQLSAASSSAWPWPAHSSPVRRCCWPTNPRATSTPGPPPKCSSFSGPSTGSSAARSCWSRTIRACPSNATVRSGWWMAVSRNRASTPIAEIR